MGDIDAEHFCTKQIRIRCDRCGHEDADICSRPATQKISVTYEGRDRSYYRCELHVKEAVDG